jgi:hypothetical protein
MAPISLDTLRHVCGGADSQGTANVPARVPPRVLSLDAGNGVLESIARAFGYEPRPGVVNATDAFRPRRK